MKHLLACASHNYGCNAKYAASSWSGQGVLLLGVIILLIFGVLNKGTRKLALGVLMVGAVLLAVIYFKKKAGV